jgi:hypothetical protein
MVFLRKGFHSNPLHHGGGEGAKKLVGGRIARSLASHAFSLSSTVEERVGARRFLQKFRLRVCRINGNGGELHFQHHCYG